MEDLVVRGTADLRLREMAAWVIPHRLWEGRRRWSELRSSGCSVRRSARVAVSGRRTNALVNTRLELLPGRLLDDVGIVIDVGANIGEWTAGVLQLAEPTQVFAFEPSPRVFPLLMGRFADNQVVNVIQAAVGDVDSTIPFYVTEHSHNASVLQPRADVQDLLDHGGSVEDRVDVDVVRLDTVLADVPSIDILKIDVQGYERSVLAGAPKTLAKTKWALLEANFVSLYDDDLLLAELNDLMVRAGFTLANLSQPYVRKGTAMFADALYRRDGASGARTQTSSG
ncbi:MAG TPA: FkbM family methyltransferase [Acidimicrobiales bacterium]|nr:FkbM family methyltransferase [Acidimicrobiales bacterium]